MKYKRHKISVETADMFVNTEEELKVWSYNIIPGTILLFAIGTFRLRKPLTGKGYAPAPTGRPGRVCRARQAARAAARRAICAGRGRGERDSYLRDGGGTALHC